MSVSASALFEALSDLKERERESGVRDRERERESGIKVFFFRRASLAAMLFFAE